MLVPYADFGSKPQASFVESTCPSKPVTVSTPRGLEWICSFPNIGPGTPGTPQLVLTVLWKVPILASVSSCEGCLTTNGRWTIKEGTSDQRRPERRFPREERHRCSRRRSCRPSSRSDPTNTNRPVGYETELEPARTRWEPAACAPTARCTPRRTPSSTTSVSRRRSPPTRTTSASRRRSREPGETAIQAAIRISAGRSSASPTLGPELQPTGLRPTNFGTDASVTFVFRVAGRALPKGYKITQVFHNGVALPTCASTRVRAQDCVVSIMPRRRARSKIWTIVATSRDERAVELVRAS